MERFAAANLLFPFVMEARLTVFSQLLCYRLNKTRNGCLGFTISGVEILAVTLLCIAVRTFQEHFSLMLKFNNQ